MPGPESLLGCVMEEVLTDDRPCPPARVDRGVEGGRRVCQICGEGDGVTSLVDVDGRDLSGCAPFARSGDVWAVRTGEDVGCPVTGALELEGDAYPEPGSVVHWGCLEARCGDSPL